MWCNLEVDIPTGQLKKTLFSEMNQIMEKKWCQNTMAFFFKESRSITVVKTDLINSGQDNDKVN